MKTFLWLVGLWFIISSAISGDLDDGIGTEDGIKTGNDLQKDLNVKFIMRKAKSQAQNNIENGDTVITGDGVMGGTNIGGVNMIGGKAGDIYIIQENKGDITTISE